MCLFYLSFSSLTVVVVSFLKVCCFSIDKDVQFGLNAWDGFYQTTPSLSHIESLGFIATPLTITRQLGEKEHCGNRNVDEIKIGDHNSYWKVFCLLHVQCRRWPINYSDPVTGSVAGHWHEEFPCGILKFHWQIIEIGRKSWSVIEICEGK